MAAGEELAPSVEAVARHAHAERILAGRRLLRQAEGNVGEELRQRRLAHVRGVEFRSRRQPVFLAALTVHDHRRHALAQASGAARGAQIRHRRRDAAARTGDAAAGHGASAQQPIPLAPSRRAAPAHGHAALDAEDDAVRARRHL